MSRWRFFGRFFFLIPSVWIKNCECYQFLICSFDRIIEIVRCQNPAYLKDRGGILSIYHSRLAPRRSRDARNNFRADKLPFSLFDRLEFLVNNTIITIYKRENHLLKVALDNSSGIERIKKEKEREIQWQYRLWWIRMHTQRRRNKVFKRQENYEEKKPRISGITIVIKKNQLRQL